MKQKAYLVKEEVLFNISLREPPRILPAFRGLKEQIQIALASTVKTLHVSSGVRRVCSRHESLTLAFLLRELLNSRSIRRPLLLAHSLLGQEPRTESQALALALLKIEARLNERSLLEIEVVRERVVQRAPYPRLVRVVRLLEGRQGASEDGGAVKDDRRGDVRFGGFPRPRCLR